MKRSSSVLGRASAVLFLAFAAFGLSLGACASSSEDATGELGGGGNGGSDAGKTDAKTDAKVDGSGGTGGVGGTGGSGGSGGSGGACNLANCPRPTGSLLQCCTSANLCGFKAGANGFCYPADAGAGGGGTGGAGGGP